MTSRKRIRKLECASCGYVARVSRANMLRGLPACPCGELLRPTDAADLVEVGLLELDDLPRPLRTALCKQLGWEDEIVRTNCAQMPGFGRGRRRRRRTSALPF